MSEELADSGSEESSFDMEAAVDSIGQDVFGAEPVVKTETEEVTEEVVETKDEEKEEIKEEVTARVAPQSWKKEMHEFWNGVDPAVQDYIEQRESQMKEGLEKDRGDANLGRTMRDVMSPYSQMLKTQNIDETAMVRNLMNAHYRISNADEAGRADLFKQLAQSYGISFDGKAEQLDPALKSMQDRLSGIEGNINASHERTLQESRDQIDADIIAFRADPAHEFFDELTDEIVDAVNNGKSLEDSYNIALRTNPVAYQRNLDSLIKEGIEKFQKDQQDEVDKARKAKAANVRGRDTSKSSTEPTGTMEDTMREVYRDIQNRSH